MDEVLYSSLCQQTTQIINMQDILANMQYRYMTILFLCSSFMLVYVLFNNFVHINPNSKYFWVVDSMHDWAIIPVISIFIICVTFFTGYKGM